MTYLLPIVGALCLLCIIGCVWILALDQRDLTRLYREMETMTPKDAYRRMLVLKYLPQCQLDMDEVNRMVEKEYPT